MDNDDEYITWPATGSGIVAAALPAGDYHAVITCYGLADESYAKIILTDTGWLMVTDEELEELEDAAALQGISKIPARVKCAVLSWHTLEELLD